MSTISGSEAVEINLAPRRTRPGLRGRRLVLTCDNEHQVPESERVCLPLAGWRCKECGSTGRKHTWLCAPLWLEGWEWFLWGMEWLRSSYSRAVEGTAKPR